jgi:transketolase
MRAAFTTTLIEIAQRDPRVVLLTGDLGFMVLEPFADRFPERFFNIGVAEQNMVGIATGLAEAGFIPFVYSIVTFATLRPYEFIRNGPILHQLPVRIVGVGGGLEYTSAGPTHLGLEDIGVLRVQPGMTIVAPADAAQARTTILRTWDLPGPVYYRLGKDDRLSVPGLDGRFELGRLQTVGVGPDMLLIVMGSVASEAYSALQLLARQGVHATLAVVASINPPPVADLVALLQRYPVVLSVEAHYPAGGVGSLVAEVIAEHGVPCRLVRCSVQQTPGVSGSQRHLYELCGLTAEALAQQALRVR